MALRVLHTQTSRGFSWRITTEVRGHGGEDSRERDVDLEYRRPGETYWHPAESYREETGRDIPSRVAREYESNARAFADRPRTAHGRRWRPSEQDLLGMLEHHRNPMVLSLKGRRVRVHSLGKGIRFHQRAWPSEAAILAHSLKQAKHITKAYGETWTNPRHRRNPLPTRTVVLTSKSTADYTISRVTDHRGETLFHVRFIGGPRAGHTGNDYVLGDLLDWVGKMGYRVRGARSNPALSKRQSVRRERRKWRGLSKADRKRIHREETVEVRDHLRNPRRRRNPADEYEDPAWRAEAIQMVRDHIAFGRDGGVSRDSVWDNLQDTLQETRRLHWFDVVAHAFDKQWPADS